MKNFARGLSILCVVALAASTATAQTIWYVNQAAPNGGDGTSWGTSFRAMRTALNVAVSGDQIWVAAGVYSVRGTANPTDPRSAEFFVGPGIQLYGGFAGNEASIAQRAGLFSTTVLSGDIGVIGDASDNAYHVVRTWGAATIDGFAIVDGNGNGAGNGGAIALDIGSLGGSPPLYQGSGLTLRNCIVARNQASRGGAMYGQLANLKIALCTFEDNSAEGVGGAVSLQTSVCRFDLCTFRRNRSDSNGGAVHLASIALTPAGRPRAQFFGCLFHDNVALGSGGAAYMGGSQFSSGNGAFTSCTFALNQAGDQGGAICAVTSTPIKARSFLENSIVWLNRAPIDADLSGNQWVWYSIAPGQTGTAVLSAVPKFVSVAQRDFRLQPNSLAIDAGSNSFLLLDALDVDNDGALLELVPLDLALQTRVLGAQVDMGAFEH